MLRGPRRRGVICCRMRRHPSTVDSTACGNVSDIQICANSHSLAMPLPEYRFWIDPHNSRSGGDDDSGPLTGNEREGWHNWGWRNWVEAAGLRRARYACGCGHRTRLRGFRRRAEGRSARLSTAPTCSPETLCCAAELAIWASSAGPLDLKALLSETVSTLFGNPRDEKLRRVIELTYFQPAPKQEAVADRLSLSFGTYRRYLTTARERLARWLWESSQLAPVQPELPPATERRRAERDNACKRSVLAAAVGCGPPLSQYQRRHARRSLRRRHHRNADHRSLALFRCLRDLAQHRFRL